MQVKEVPRFERENASQADPHPLSDAQQLHSAGEENICDINYTITLVET